MDSPVLASHTRAVLSEEAVTMRNPSGLNTALRTGPLCSLRILSGSPLLASQILAVLSSEAVTTRVPSGLNEAKLT
jgi:hypothetical protein